jgi:hypothetical protein
MYEWRQNRKSVFKHEKKQDISNNKSLNWTSVSHMKKKVLISGFWRCTNEIFALLECYVL